jgi:hypothetical protein
LNRNQSGIVNDFIQTAAVRPPAIAHGEDEFGPFTRIVGSEVIGEVLVNTSGTTNETRAGDVLNIVYINPLFFRNTRVRVISGVFLKFLLEHASLHYQSVTASIAQGGIVITPVNDPQVSFSTSSGDFSAVTRAMNFENAIGFNVYNEAICHFPRDAGDDPYFMKATDEPRFSFPGAFYVISQTSHPPIEAEFSRSVGILTVNYSFKFYHQVLRIADIDFPAGSHDFTPNPATATDFYEFSPTSIMAYEPVRLVRAWFTGIAGFIEPGKIGELTITDDFIIDGGVYTLPNMTDSEGHIYNWVSGTILYVREAWLEAERCIVVSPTLAFHGNESGLYWTSAKAVPAGIITAGSYTMRIFDLE